MEFDLIQVNIRPDLGNYFVIEVNFSPCGALREGHDFTGP
jgi:hypothetical protein